MNKRLGIIKQPAFHTLQSIQKSLRKLSVICFPEPEFRTVNSRKKGILIQTFLYQLL